MTEEILHAITVAVENAVDKKINGKLMGITAHLVRQDETLVEVKQLLEERKFLSQLWSFLRYIGGVVVSLGAAYLLYKNINK